MEKYVNRPLSDKSMKYCIVVVDGLTNDISYNAKLNLLFWGKIVNVLC